MTQFQRPVAEPLYVRMRVWYGADFWLLRIFIFALSQRIHKFSAIIVKCAFYYCCYLYLVVRQIVRAKFISVSQSNYVALSR